jgi:SAM-dependent methyltransferase
MFYTELASWWPLMSAPSEYEEEAAFYARVLEATGRLPGRILLELGSGGGNNASHMKARFDMTLVDVSPGMVEVSRALNPELDHHVGDMRDVRLGRTFDLVFIHDAICYMASEDDLRRAFSTARVHLRPGGAALFAPDYVVEHFRPGTDHGGHDGAGRALRYLEWVWDPDPSDTWYYADYTFALREPDGAVHVAFDRHVEGLFPCARWLALLDKAGFDARAVPFEHSELEPGSALVFAGISR